MKRMSSHLRANLWLLGLSLLLCSALYPLVLLGIGQAVFPHQAEGSLLRDSSGKVIGSHLIAQPFADKDGKAKDEYFQPRPSAASYRPDASGASNWAVSNYKLRDRVARALGPIVRYGGTDSTKQGRLVGPDVESWFAQDRFQGQPHLVAQWAQAHPAMAQAWVKADKLNTDYVAQWQDSHLIEIEKWIAKNREHQGPTAEDLAVPFFESYSRSFPGTWPVATAAEGQAEKRIERVKKGSDIQSVFFDMWRQEHPQEDLEQLPADLVMASGSGLDPHITLKNALFQLDRVAEEWAKKRNAPREKIRREIEAIVQDRAEAPFGGLVGVKLINVLEVNLTVRERYGN
jgi:K+-transporting ATPase ATPase C chain